MLARTVAFHWLRNLSADIISKNIRDFAVDGTGVIPSLRRVNGLSDKMAFPFVVGEQRYRETAASGRGLGTKSRLIVS